MTCTVKINRILSKTYFTRFAMLAFATVYCLTVRWQQGLQIMNLPFWDWPLPELDLSDYSGQYRLLPSLLSQHSSTTNRHISMSYYLDGLCCSNRRSCEQAIAILNRPSIAPWPHNSTATTTYTIKSNKVNSATTDRCSRNRCKGGFSCDDGSQPRR